MLANAEGLLAQNIPVDPRTSEIFSIEASGGEFTDTIVIGVI